MDFQTLRSERDVETKLIQPLFDTILGYPADDLRWSVPVSIQFGHEKKSKEADLVAYLDGRPVITVEAKSPKESLHRYLNQVDSYAFYLQTPYSLITNGRHIILRGYYSFNSRINILDEDISDLAEKNWQSLINLISFTNVRDLLSEAAPSVVAPDREKITDFRKYFRKLHNIIRDRDKLDPASAFDELSKVLFLKAAEDEWIAKGDTKPVLSPDKIDEWHAMGGGLAKRLIDEWYTTATSAFFPGVFDDNPHINLSPVTLSALLRQMVGFTIRGEDTDIKGRAFEEFLPSQFRGKGLGQFFTPRPIVNFMAELAEISIHDVVADFACGSGGFLIKAFEKMEEELELLPDAIISKTGFTKPEILDEIKNHQIYGIDAEPRAARTAKMNMLLWGDGRKVVRGNGLAGEDHNGNPYELREYCPKDQGSGCTLILANPPFGSSEKDKSVLRRYELGSKLKERQNQKTEILFLERGLKLLRPGGRMLIVIPQGLLSGARYDYVREFILQNSVILAVITLPTHTFTQSGVQTVNTCILVVEKHLEARAAEIKALRATKDRLGDFAGLAAENRDLDYDIFLGIAQFIGFEPSGRSIISDDELSDLDLLLSDYRDASVLASFNADLFEFATRNYGERAARRREQVVRGSKKGDKVALRVKLSETEGRLDPPYYFFRASASTSLSELPEVGRRVQERNTRYDVFKEDISDALYASVSSDGLVTFSDLLSSIDSVSRTYRPKIVRPGDFVYNPMRVNIGSVGIVPEFEGVAVTSPDYVVFRAKDIEPAALLALLRSPFYKMYIDITTTGSIRNRLYFRDLANLKMPRLNDREQSMASHSYRKLTEEDAAHRERMRRERESSTSLLQGILSDYWHFENEADVATRFESLARKWQQETGHLSSLSKKLQHPAYQEMVGLGSEVVPLLLSELAQSPGFWFIALEEITGVHLSGGKSVGVEELRQRWLEWGRVEGLI